MTFFLSFIETLLHSIWQAALLLSVYLLVNNIEKKFHPLQKRNFLYILLLSQLSISIITFLSFINGSRFALTIGFTNALKQPHLLFLSNYYSIIFTIYMIIVLIKFLQIIFQWTIFKTKYAEKLKKPSANLKAFILYHSQQLSLRRTVTLWFSNTIKTPVTFGFFKPVILLPISLINNITTQQAEIIILHELIHIKSKDYLLNWFLLFMETIYFFNPFIKIAAEKLTLEREKNCDIQVLNYEYGVVRYAETLYEIAQNNIFLKRFQLGVFKNNSQLYKRIIFFSNDKNLSFKKCNLFFLIVLGFLLTGFISFLMVGKTTFRTPSTVKAIAKAFNESYQKKLRTSPPISEEIVGFKETKFRRLRKEKQSVKNLTTKAALVDNNAEENELSYIPVSLNEKADSTKEIIYFIENNKTTITQSYKVIRRNGILMFEPQWMVKVTKDTTLPVIKSDSVVLDQ